MVGEKSVKIRVREVSQLSEALLLFFLLTLGASAQPTGASSPVKFCYNYKDLCYSECAKWGTGNCSGQCDARTSETDDPRDAWWCMTVPGDSAEKVYCPLRRCDRSDWRRDNGLR